MEKREAKKLQKEQNKLQKQEIKLLKENIKLKKEIEKEKGIKDEKSKVINEIIGKNTGASQICDDMLVKIDEMLEKLKVNAQKSNVKKSKPINKSPKTEWAENTCSYIFKRGKNKGLQCRCKKPFKYATDLTNPTFDPLAAARKPTTEEKSQIMRNAQKVQQIPQSVSGLLYTKPCFRLFLTSSSLTSTYSKLLISSQYFNFWCENAL